MKWLDFEIASKRIEMKWLDFEIASL